MPKLSVIVPSIRPQNLLAIYNSIDIEDFEMIVVGPFIPMWWSDKLKFIESYRSPNACQQQALSIAKGELITFASDDGIFLKGTLDKAIKKIETYECLNVLDNSARETLLEPTENKNLIVVGKYLEGDNPINMESEDYYKFGYHKAYRLKGVPQNNIIFNCGLISGKFMIELGGWDAEHFDCTTIGHADLGIRASQAGAKMILMEEQMFKCSHQPGKSGDHAPIHRAMKTDLIAFEQLYSKARETRIDINNWKNTPEKWTRFR